MNPTAVRCPHCQAAEYQPCTVVGSGLRLNYSTAHPSRLERAGLQPEWQAVEKYRKDHAQRDGLSAPEG